MFRKAFIALVVVALAAVAGSTLAIAGGPPDDKPERGNDGRGHDPITICHVTGSESHPFETITVDDDSVNLTAHLRHGDTIGACPEPEPEPPVPPIEPPVDPPSEPPVVPPTEPPTVPPVDPPTDTPPVDPPGPPDDVPPVVPPIDEDDGPEPVTECEVDCDPEPEPIPNPTKLPNGGNGGLARTN